MELTSILLIVVMIIAFYFLIIRPQRKRQQQQADMVKTLQPGARVVTNTGIYGSVVAVGEKQMVLETSPGSRITVLKQAVGRVVDEAEEDAELSAYRGAGAAGAAGLAAEQEFPPADQSYADADSSTAVEDDQASGMAGGAPIQEYAPGSGPDFTAPGEQYDDSHQTSPWPAEGQDVSGSDDPAPVADDSYPGDQSESTGDEQSGDDSRGR